MGGTLGKNYDNFFFYVYFDFVFNFSRRWLIRIKNGLQIRDPRPRQYLRR